VPLALFSVVLAVMQLLRQCHWMATQYSQPLLCQNLKMFEIQRNHLKGIGNGAESLVLNLVLARETGSNQTGDQLNP
jgi:hypothetical protein